MALPSGHQIVSLKEEEQNEQCKNFLAYSYGLARIQPGNCLVMKTMIPSIKQIYDFEFRPSDVFIITYPKCGTTWTQEIVWTMKNNPNLDHPLANTSIFKRSPFLEMDGILHTPTLKPPSPDSSIIKSFKQFFPNADPMDGVVIKMAGIAPNPRTLKTHYPISLLNPKIFDTCKVVYVARNPKDVAVSYLHHSRFGKNVYYVGSQDQFVDYFIKNDLLYGSYGLHLKEALEKKTNKNFLLLTYEDMKSDPKGTIKSLDTFLETNLSEKQIENVVHHTSFAEMKKREAEAENDELKDYRIQEVVEKEGGFFRKGISGDWKEKLTDEQIEKINTYTKNQIPKEFHDRYL